MLFCRRNWDNIIVILFVFREKNGLERKDFLDNMIELRNRDKNITQTASFENVQKNSPTFSKFFKFGCDVTAVQWAFPFM